MHLGALRSRIQEGGKETRKGVNEFFRLLTVMQNVRWHVHYEIGCTEHSCRCRVKSFPAGTGGHLSILMRYVERNPV